MSSINGGIPIAMLDCWWYITFPSHRVSATSNFQRPSPCSTCWNTSIQAGPPEDVADVIFSGLKWQDWRFNLGRIQKNSELLYEHTFKKSAWKVFSNIYKWLILLFPSNSQLIICLIEGHNIIQSPTALSGQSWSVVVRLCRGEGQLWHGLALGFDSCCEDPKLGTPPDQNFQERMQWMCFIVWYISVVFEFWKNYFCGFEFWKDYEFRRIEKDLRSQEEF